MSRSSSAIFAVSFLAACSGGKLDVGTAKEPQGTESTATPDASAPVPMAATFPAHRSCGLATPITEDFENGMPLTWSAAPARLGIETANPVVGTKSLRFRIDPASPTFTIVDVPSCVLTMKLALRTDDVLLAGAQTGIASVNNKTLIARLEAGSGGLTLSSPGLSAPITVSPLVAYSPVVIEIAIDLVGRQIFTASAPLGSPLPAPDVTSFTTDAPQIDTLIFGSVASFGATTDAGVSGSGEFWIDDLSLE